MVAIDIRKADKVNGEWGMFITFPYDEQLLKIIKELCPKAWWHGVEREWELPLNKLTELVNNMSNYEIKLTGELSALEEKKVPNIDFKFKTKPFDHQIDGFNYGLTHDKWLLGDSMGLGKTWQVITIAVAKKQLLGYKHCLIICGINGLKWNWLKEINKHSDDSGYILGQRTNTRNKLVIGSNADKFNDVEKLFDENSEVSQNYFIITNVESLRDEKITNGLKKLCDDGTIGMIALDECHTCFDFNTPIRTDRGLLKIGDIVENRLNVSVMSFNEDTQSVEWKPIKNWFKNFVNEPLVELKLNTSNGVKTIKCTRTHRIYTNNRGWVNAEDLTSDDDIREC